MTGRLYVLLLSGVMATVCGAKTTATENEQTATEWLDRSQRYAEKLRGSDRWTIWRDIAAIHAEAGRLEGVLAALDNIEAPQRREQCMTGLPGLVASGGDRDGAISLAEMIKDRALRDEGLIGVVLADNVEHNFADAIRTVGLINNATVATRAWRRIARRQAEAGQYDAALASAANMLTETNRQQKYAMETLAFISKAKASGLKRSPTKSGSTLAEGARSVAKMFVGADLLTEDIGEIKAKAEASEGAGERTSLWRQIAWLCHKGDDADGCCQALDTATRHAEEISDSYQRSINYVLIADLRIELGNQEEARNLVDKAREAEKDLGIFRGLASFTSAPVAVGVMVRCGKIEEAFELARTYGDEEDGVIWQSLGAFCASVGNTDEVERQLEKIESDEIKGYLCLGVWYALRKDEMTTHAK